MQKTAQKRSILNKLREMTNVSGIAAEKFFNPEFQRVMESLREKDNSIRAIISGEEIEGADPGSDPISLKDLFKSAKSNFNRREYMTAVAELGRFHKKLFDAQQAIQALSLDVDQVHHEFLFKDLGDEHKKQLVDLKTRFATRQYEEITKEAGIMDFFVNIGTKRGRALAAWEKRYPKQIGRLKKDTSNLLNRSELALTQVLSALKEMASARATRNLDNYMKAADKISKSYQVYDKSFKDYYLTNVKGFLEKIDLVSPTEQVLESKELGKQDIPTEKKTMEIPTEFGPAIKTDVTVPPPSQPMPTTPSPPPSGMSSIPASVPPTTPSAPTALAPGMPSIPATPSAPTGVPSKTTDTTPSPPPSFAPESEKEDEYSSDLLAKKMWGKSSHVKFLASLESLSGESPLILASYIKKYATKIQGVDPEVSLHLFKIAKSIRG